MATKHPTYVNRKIPHLQLLASLSRFNGAQPPLSSDTTAGRLDPEYQINQIDTKRRSEYTKPINNIFHAESEEDYATPSNGKRRVPSPRREGLVIGGQVSDNPWTTTASDVLSSDAKSKPPGSKRLSHTANSKPTTLWGDAFDKGVDSRPGTAGASKIRSLISEQDRPSTLTDEILQKVRSEIASRGARGFTGLQRKFKIIDDDGSKSINFEEFKKAMHEMRISVSDLELRALFRRFDISNDGCLTIDEFLSAIRGELNKRRKDLISLAFSVLDKDGSGMVDFTDIKDVYNAKRHPDVLSGRRSEEAVLMEFLDTFDVGGERDGCVTRDEFLSYYANVSASIDDDDYFELMIRNAWHISGGEGWCANTSNKRVLVTGSDGRESVQEARNDSGVRVLGADPAIGKIGANQKEVDSTKPKDSLSKGNSSHPRREEDASSDSVVASYGSLVLDKVRSQLVKRGTKGMIGLSRKFASIDDDRSKALSFREFSKGMKELKLSLTDADINVLFLLFDRDRSESVSLDEFMLAVRGEMNKRRRYC